MSERINNEKQALLEKLLFLKNKLDHIESKFKIDLSDLKHKVEKAINNIQNDVFSIAFFGAFSDGKSTILSVLLNRLDIDISPEPTTDKIRAYKIDDYQIVDTPGLFSEHLIHDDLTKKYISEANIIIYTVDPVNPLKESHLKVVKWILSDLGKLESAIFVINKMDEVADLEDEIDFEKNAKIKQEVILGILKDELGIERFDRIICVAADPFGLGLNYWMDRIDDYRKLSRIGDLEDLILDFKSKYEKELKVRAGISVIRDASIKLISELNRLKKTLTPEIDLLKSQIEEYDSRIKVLEKDINRSYTNIKSELIALREDILVEIDSASSISELRKILQKRLGERGYVLQEIIDLIIKKHTSSLVSETIDIVKSIDESLMYHSNIQEVLVDQLSDMYKSIVSQMFTAPTREIGDALNMTRDILLEPVRVPWNRGARIVEFLKNTPFLVEIFRFATDVWRTLKIDEKRDELTRAIENSFKKLFENFTIEKYIDTYFPSLSKTRKILLNLNESKEQIQDVILNINMICREINIDMLG